jgi:hypothetical protein
VVDDISHEGLSALLGGVRHLFAAYELGEDKLFGHVKPRKNRARFLEFCATSAPSTHPRSGSRSSATTSHPT